VREQLQAEGGLSYVQFEVLAKLVDAGRPLTMTELADGVVYSRSGLTHQAGLLETQG
jgi:DNA-binding MarR family transcriptional regulator